MGTLHAWESFGDGVAVRLLIFIHSVLVCPYGGRLRPARYPGSRKRSWRRVSNSLMIMVSCSRIMSIRYASIAAILMSQKIADGIRDNSGLWKHGHTYQVCPHLFLANSMCL